MLISSQLPILPKALISFPHSTPRKKFSVWSSIKTTWISLETNRGKMITAMQESSVPIHSPKPKMYPAILPTTKSKLKKVKLINLSQNKVQHLLNENVNFRTFNTNASNVSWRSNTIGKQTFCQNVCLKKLSLTHRCWFLKIWRGQQN